MSNYYFVRHGQSLANTKQVHAGSEDDSPLTDKGVHEAVIAGKQANKLDIDYIVSSPQKRASDTATIIAHAIGYQTDKIVIDNSIRERGLGEGSGKPYGWLESFAEYDEIPGLEVTIEVKKRVEHFIEELKKIKAKNILIVSHLGVYRMLDTLLHGEPASSWLNKERADNARIIKINLSNE